MARRWQTDLRERSDDNNNHGNHTRAHTPAHRAGLLVPSCIVPNTPVLCHAFSGSRRLFQRQKPAKQHNQPVDTQACTLVNSQHEATRVHSHRPAIADGFTLQEAFSPRETVIFLVFHSQKSHDETENSQNITVGEAEEGPQSKKDQKQLLFNIA